MVESSLFATAGLLSVTASAGDSLASPFVDILGDTLVLFFLFFARAILS